MPKALTKKEREIVIDYLKNRPTMPHFVASEELKKIGIATSLSNVMRIRQREGLEFIKNTKITPIIRYRMKSGQKITADWILQNYPDILPEHAALIEKRALSQIEKEKKESEDDSAICHIHRKGNAMAHVMDMRRHAFVAHDAVSSHRPSSLAFSVQQLMVQEGAV